MARGPLLSAAVSLNSRSPWGPRGACRPVLTHGHTVGWGGPERRRRGSSPDFRPALYSLCLLRLVISSSSRFLSRRWLPSPWSFRWRRECIYQALPGQWATVGLRSPLIARRSGLGCTKKSLTCSAGHCLLGGTSRGEGAAPGARCPCVNAICAPLLLCDPGRLPAAC